MDLGVTARLVPCWAVRGWRRRVRVHDYRDADEQAEKLADKFIEIRALTLFRLESQRSRDMGRRGGGDRRRSRLRRWGSVDHSRCQAAARRQYRRLVVVHQHGRTYRDERERPYPIQGRRGGTFSDGSQSNSPACTPAVNADHCAAVNVSTDPAWFLLSRTARVPSRSATSMQLPPWSLLYVRLCHVGCRIIDILFPSF